MSVRSFHWVLDPQLPVCSMNGAACLGMQITVAYGSLYVIFLWIYHAASGDWVYEALDWSKPLAPVLYLMLPVLLFVSFLVWYGSTSSLILQLPTSLSASPLVWSSRPS